MKRNLFDNEEIGEIHDDFGDFEKEEQVLHMSHSPRSIQPIHADWNIVSAFNVINEYAPKSQLKHSLFIKCAEAFDYLSKAMDLNAIQCIVVAMLIENGKAMSFRQMGKALGLTRLSMMTYYNDLEDLFRKRWLHHRGAQEADGVYDGYILVKGVVSAVRENRPFQPEILECEDTQEFVEKVANHLNAGNYVCDPSLFNDEKHWIREIITANQKLPICKAALELQDLDAMSLLMLVIADYCNYNGTNTEGLGSYEVNLVYPENSPNSHRIANMMRKGTHQLFHENLIEHKCVDGMADTEQYVATSHLKHELLADFTAINPSDNYIPKMNGVKSCKDITPKSLFYNEAEFEQVERLRNILSQEQLPIIQERLKGKGMRTGVCVLMHGQPGTGKTATVYELARQTGRDIIQVQVTDFKDKYVGESEAKLKNIFNNYRQCCKNSSVMPILLLNEGDAILSKRIENVERSTEQMMNALQNIILEEMENLQGIMIVTTNLTSNLDKAFERRFIFKIKFEKPGQKVKANIWQSLIDTLDNDEANELATMFDVTGGEIENIARKSTMEYILTGKDVDVEMIKNFAKQEKIESGRTAIGFMNK